MIKNIKNEVIREIIKVFSQYPGLLNEKELSSVLKLAEKENIDTKDIAKSILNKFSKIQRVKKTIAIFLENNGAISDEQLAHLLTVAGVETSSSTVGRDLTGDMAKEILSEDEYNNIVLLRAQNLLKGKQKGGQNYALNNTFQKDEHGKFTGSTRNGRQI